MKKFIVSLAVCAFGLGASHAFAECDDAEEAAVGKAAAAATASAISKAVAPAGKQMMNIATCTEVPGGYVAEFRFNYLASDGLYWAEGTAKVSGNAVSDLKLKHLSPNLAEAAAKNGLKLASN